MVMNRQRYGLEQFWTPSTESHQDGSVDRRRMLKLMGGAGLLALVGTRVKTEGTDAAAGGSLKTTSALNLRSGPSTSHRILLVIPKGAHVVDLGEQRNGFRKVTYANTRGWASQQYLKAGNQIP